MSIIDVVIMNYMGKALLISVEPTILRYARKNSGYSLEEVAKKAKIKVERLESYEENTTEIPLPHLERFANIYKRPLAFFLLLKIPDGLVEPKDFRIVFSSDKYSEFSPKYYLAIRRARYIQTVFSELAEDKFNYKFPVASLDNDPKKISAWFRDFINISFEKQKKWSSPNEALREWKRALEEKNIFVLQASLTQDSISAFCLTDKLPYIIVLNSSEHEYRRIFSLLHEVGHILLRKSGICTPDNLSRNSYDYQRIEKFCNQFAASVLLPQEDFEQIENVQALIRTPFSSWDEDLIRRASQSVKVSKEVFLRRLLTLGHIQEAQYEVWRKKWVKDSESYEKPKKGKVIIPQYVKCISQNGHAFTSFVLEQFHNNKLTYTGVSEILNIAPKHISTLEMKL